MTDPDNSYRPHSPDFSNFQSPFPSNNVYHSSQTASHPAAYPLTSPVAHRASYDASPFFNPQYQRPAVPASRISQQYIPPVSQTDYFGDYQHNDLDMSRRSARVAARAVDGASVSTLVTAPVLPSAPGHVSGPVPCPATAVMPAAGYAAPVPPAEAYKPSPGAGVEVKTKFPVARIKRIMQADEDVGKVAQVTPIAVSKALELFMISLVTKAAKEARDRNSKRITAFHLKQAVAKDEVLDFLADIIAKVPDGKKKEDEGSDQTDGRRRRGRRLRDEVD